MDIEQVLEMNDQQKEKEKEVAAVLIVDDEPLVLAALEETLKQDKHTLFCVATGEEALEILKNESIALIICDQRLPGISGVEVLKQAQQMSPDTIRIILTGSGDLKTAIKSINIGQVAQYITKPWDETDLRQTVNHHVEHYRLIKQNQKLQLLTLAQHQKLKDTHAALCRDLKLAARIQEELLIGRVPEEVETLDIAAITVPSKEIDGDFFEFYTPNPETLDVVIGDVMGKGIPAALVGTAIKIQLIRFAIPSLHTQTLLHKGPWHHDLLSPSQILHEVQRAIAMQLINLEYFSSLFYGRFDLTRRQFIYVDCGSPKPLHYHSEKNVVSFLSGSNVPMGVLEAEEFRESSVSFQEGDCFVFYSDAIHEAQSPEGEFFGTERLKQLVQNHAHLSSHGIEEIIKQQVLAFIDKENSDDDLTIIVIKIKNLKTLPENKTKSATFYSDLSQLQDVRDFIARACNHAPGNREVLSGQLQLAVNEIFCNILEHGYEESSGPVRIEVDQDADGIAISLFDQGHSFKPEFLEEPDLAGTKDRGFGWKILREVADSVTYAPKNGEEGWNQIRLFKKFMTHEAPMDLQHAVEKNILVIVPQGNHLDAKNASEFKEAVVNLIGDNSANNVVLDLSPLKFIDSSGLGCLLSILRLLHTRGGELKLAALDKTVRTMFEIVSMHKVFDIFNTKEEALGSFE